MFDTPGPHPPPAEFSMDMLVFDNPDNLSLKEWYIKTLNGKEFDYTDMAPKIIEPDYNLELVNINGNNTLKIETRMASGYRVKRYFLNSNSHIVEIMANFIMGHAVTGTKTGLLLDQVVASFKTTAK